MWDDLPRLTARLKDLERRIRGLEERMDWIDGQIRAYRREKDPRSVPGG